MSRKLKHLLKAMSKDNVFSSGTSSSYKQYHLAKEKLTLDSTYFNPFYSSIDSDH